ncbi:MAG: CusA/CzcA family heavy metal efflux RND transporter [Candidatus Sericytochromatia bacterium]|nr:CusA/CzcA family heavy metal efflux RND transporter [Candidatus Sericytochromatia bacterium]
MFNRILAFSIRQRWFVLLVVAAIALLGVYNFQHLPIDAVPDITNVQVQINTSAPGYTPQEAEQQITFPIESTLSGLPKLKSTRSLSRYGLSQVTVIFEEGTDIFFARQLLNEKLQQIRSQLPAGLEPELGPIASGLGEIYMWTVEAEPDARQKDGSPYDLFALRTLQDWVIRPQIRTVPGVTEVNTIGGYRKMFQISPRPERLQAYGMSFRDVVIAVEANNANVGAGYLESYGTQQLLRVPGRLQDRDDLGRILLKNVKGIPVALSDVARIEYGRELRTGAATRDGKETVLGTAVMLLGANSREVSEAVHARLEVINASLPAGVRAVPVYNRSTLVDQTIHTVEKNLVEGALLVIVILFLFLGNFRAALITALVIPFSMCWTISGMFAGKISANLMSLGALDFGIIVDGSVVIAENCLRHLSERQHELGRALTLKERLNAVWEASKEARQALLFGELIIMVVYLPILTLEGIEGKMFRPMALTVVVALAGAMLLSVTFVPAAIALLMGGRVAEQENMIVRLSKRLYQPALSWALSNRVVILVSAGVLIFLSGIAALKMGSEFIPSLDEGDMTVQALRIPGTSLSQSIAMQEALETRLRKVPEVEKVFARIGTAEVATDPMPPGIADTYIIMKPRSEWPMPKQPKSELVNKIRTAVQDLPGNNYEFAQPIQMRFNELISGVRAALAVKVYGEDLDLMRQEAQKIANTLSAIPGAKDVQVEQVSGLSVLTIKPKFGSLRRYGLNVRDIQEIIQAAGSGLPAGEIFEGDRRFEIVVRLPVEYLQDASRLRELPVPLPKIEGQAVAYIPLSQVASIEMIEGPNQISRENGKRRVVVSANVQGRDLGSFVSEAQKKVQSKVKMPDGMWLEWGGEFENLISATRRLQIVVPVALVLILLLLNATLHSIKDSLLVFSGVPLALTGGIAALAVRGLPFSITAGVGFIALSGVAVLNGLVMLTFIRQLRYQGFSLYNALLEGAMTRLRPVMMTALVASLGFVPMAIATGTGSEVQRPLATVVIGGILSSTLLTLFVLPVLYQLFHYKSEELSLESSDSDTTFGEPSPQLELLQLSIHEENTDEQK